MLVVSSDSISSFDPDRIIGSIVRETGLDEKIAEVIASAVVSKLRDREVVSPDVIRELVCSELSGRGYTKERLMYSRKSVRFNLDPTFYSKYVGRQPKWGPIGYVTYKRTYARVVEDEDRTEEFYETVKRVVEGVFTIQKRHCFTIGLPWDEEEAQRKAQRMFEKIWNFKFLPPGRGLWMMGTEFVEKHGSMALNNCAFVSTESIDIDPSIPFEFLMDALMLGVGVGFDTKGAGKITIKRPSSTINFTVPDSRGGWVLSLRLLLRAYFLGEPMPRFDYSKIRPKGERIKGFGGVASGPGPLMEMHRDISSLLRERIGKEISSADIVDIMNLIGKCVVAGNVRRCLPKGTLVHTRKGLIPIEKIKKGMEVATSGGYGKVSEVLNQGVQEVITIKTQMGEFKCTPNHKIAVMSNIGKYIWKYAEEINEGDRLVFPIHEIEGEKTSLPKWKYNKPKHSTTCKDITIPDLDADMAWFLGYFHGNGYVYPNFENDGFNASVSVSCPTDRPRIVQKCREQLQRFGVNIYEPDVKGNYVVMRAMSKQLAWYLDHFKKAKEEIDIPDYILRATPDIRKAYLAGLFDADGSSLTRPLNLVTTVYKSFAYQVKSLYASIGIPTRIREQKRKNPKWKTIYHVNLVGSWCIDRFENTVAKYAIKYFRSAKTKRSQNDYGFPAEWIISNGIKYGRKWARNSRQMTYSTLLACGGTTNRLIPVEVLSIDKTPVRMETFDISVSEYNEFIVSDGLLVHNSAQIALGEHDDDGYISLKDPELYSEELMHHRWASNNSVIAEKGMDYSKIVDSLVKNGEPGILWLENSRAYGRMIDPPDWRDKNVKGVNPCGEQSLESFELCCLVETFPSNHESYEEFEETLEYAYLYAKTVTLVNTHWDAANAVMLKNRRMGISQTGIIDAFAKHGKRTILEWADRGYRFLRNLDEKFSDRFCIPKSIKITTVKPSGTVSLLAGVSPGIHYPYAEYYIRRVRIAKNSELVPILQEAGYPCEESVTDSSTLVFEFPIKTEHFTKCQRDVSIWEQVANAVDFQRYWSDNQVSITVSFKREETDQIKSVLEFVEDKLKSISFLPFEDHGYVQAPYEEITKEEYERRVSSLKPINMSGYSEAGEGVEGCDGDHCNTI